MNHKLILTLFFTSVAVLCTQTVFAQASGNPAAGQAKYQMFCATCHGPTGKGDGVAANGLTPKPRNFTDKAAMAQKTDAQLKKVIQLGGAANGLSPSMPPWGSALSEQDIANVIAYIRSLK